MHLANLTTATIKKTSIFIFVIFTATCTFAQVNAPYSRYGVGEFSPPQNIVSRTMGGISTGFVDVSGFLPYAQSINLTNPAALGSLGLNTTIFDFGLDVDRRTLKSKTTSQKYSANNANIAYIQLGFPITPKRMLKKGNAWGVAFGLKPLSKISYKIQENIRVPGIDSTSTLFEGAGGINQVNISTGVRIKNLSFGLTTGYSFGNRDISSRKNFNNDTITYQQSNIETISNFGGAFLNLGVQYAIKLQNKGLLRIGATANLKQTLKGKRDNLVETFYYNDDGTISTIDIIDTSKNISGKVNIPASYSVGFTYTNPHWVTGVDIDFSNLSNYSYFGAKDLTQNAAKFRFGAQYYPANQNTPTNKYWRFVKYRGGFYYGTDYVKLSDSRSDYGVTLGAGLPLTSFQRLRFGDFVTLNTGVEIGQRGNKQNIGVKEGVFRVNFGISMTASWFQKRKYD
jgi:hypothetical protein